MGSETRAILFTDIVGYSKAMSNDEALALALLSEHDKILGQAIKSSNGRVIKNIGDAFFAEFDSADDALLRRPDAVPNVESHSTSKEGAGMDQRAAISELAEVHVKEHDTRQEYKADAHGGAAEDVMKMAKEIGDAEAPAAMLNETVYFAFDKSELSSEARAKLDAVAAAIAEAGDAVLSIKLAGHTDEIGTEAYNQALSERRAGAVRDYLKAKGIAADLLTLTAYGETRPAASNGTEEGRSQNRRVNVEATKR